MESTLIKLEKKINLPRELLDKIFIYSNIYFNIWEKKILKNFQEIKKQKPKIVWATLYKLNQKLYNYYLVKKIDDTKQTFIVTNYSEKTYDLQDINYLLKNFIEKLN